MKDLVVGCEIPSSLICSKYPACFIQRVRSVVYSDYKFVHYVQIKKKYNAKKLEKKFPVEFFFVWVYKNNCGASITPYCHGYKQYLII